MLSSIIHKYPPCQSGVWVGLEDDSGGDAGGCGGGRGVIGEEWGGGGRAGVTKREYLNLRSNGSKPWLSGEDSLIISQAVRIRYLSQKIKHISLGSY